MADSSRIEQSPQSDSAWKFFKRGLKLRCPECGETPIFAREIHSLKDWVCPLEGCPRCGYKYEREPGYFLISTWAINYGVIGALGLATVFLINNLTVALAIVLVLLPILNFLFIRHSKALYLAMDHYLDPVVKKC
ncbi:MAG TPA: hypothetical protein VEK08_20640 [Planctomycetota bacterium]|nr:hypothetical protein [Planctomycetota bacterium]